MKPRKKINARARGNAYQRDVAAWLQARGWIVRNFPVTIQPLRRGRVTIYRAIKQDVFGADIIARKGVSLIWVQVQGLKGRIKSRVKEFGRYFSGGLGDSENIFIFTKIKGGWKIKNVLILIKINDDFEPAGYELLNADYGKILGGVLYLKPGQETVLFDKQLDEIESIESESNKKELGK